jgi:hypothetical protein
MSRRGNTEGGLAVVNTGQSGKRLPRWATWSAAGLVLFLAAITSGGWGPFVVLAIGGTFIVLDCWRHGAANVLRYLGAIVFVVAALLPNAIAGPLARSSSSGVNQAGDDAATAVANWWNARGINGPVVNLQSPVAPATTTTTTTTPTPDVVAAAPSGAGR